MRLTHHLDNLYSDVRLAIRQLASAPGFTFVAALTLALGIGVNSAIFGLADAALMRPLPFGQADRLMMLWERTPTSPKSGVSPLNWRDWRAQSQLFDDMAFVQQGMGGGPLLTAPDGSIESAERQVVTSNFFQVLDVPAIAGRTFRPEDERASPRAVLLGDRVWRRRFNADPAVAGSIVRLNGLPYTVVGVISSDIQFRRPAEIWTVSASNFPDTPSLRTARGLDVVGRLKPGVTMEAGQAEMTVIADRLAREYPEANKGAGAIVEPIRAGIVGRDLQTTTVFLLAVVGFVLLLCCANVANLLLARATARAREIAIRSALGAERGRIIRQLLTESLVLATIGGTIGLGLGAAILQAAPALIPPGLLPAAVNPAFDVRVAMFSAAATLVVGVLFGLIPAWQATGVSLASVMASESRSATSRGSRLRRLLVSSEVAAAVLLLCGAGLLVKTLLTLIDGDPGYRTPGESVLTLDFSVPWGKDTRYPTDEALAGFYDAVARDVGALPEVRRVGWSSSLPYGTSEFGRWMFEIQGEAPVEGDKPTAEYTLADPGYFRTLDLPIVRGRGFDARDALRSVPVCLVNEALVRKHFKGRDPIGARLWMKPTYNLPAQVREIVGVVRQTSGEPDAPEELLQMYVPLAQYPRGDVYMVVQPSSGAAEALTPLVRRVVAQINPDVPVRRDRTIEVLAIQSTAGYRFRAVMAGSFAVLALALAMIGVFGVLAYTVQQRRREIGVRIALGASGARVMWLVFRDAGLMIATGAIAGIALAMFASRVIATFLFGVNPLDPLTFVSVPVVILLTAIAAAAVPAWRASRIDPVVAFRQD